MFFVVQDVIDWATQREGMQTTVLVLSCGMLLLCLLRCDVRNCFVTAVSEAGSGQTAVCTYQTRSADREIMYEAVFQYTADVRLMKKLPVWCGTQEPLQCL